MYTWNEKNIFFNSINICTLFEMIVTWRYDYSKTNYFIPWEFSTSALADCLSLKSILLSVFWSISTMLKGRWSRFVLQLSTLPSPILTLWTPKCADYKWYHHYLHVPQLSYLSIKVQILVFLFAFFDFHSAM